MTTDEQVLTLLIEAERDGNAPTTTELADWTGRTYIGVWYALNRLERKGLVKINGRGRAPYPRLVRVVRNANLQNGVSATTVQPIFTEAKHG